MVDAVLVVLAVLGFLALIGQLLRAAARLGLAAIEKTAASGLSDVAARRGDLTGLAERRGIESRARQGRRRAALLVVAWLVLLVVPPLAGWAREAYAAATLLWLLPRHPALRRPIRPG